MSSSSASSGRTCPVCGARNSDISLFCAECGSPLNGDGDPRGETAAIPTQSTGSQHTEPFSPIASNRSGNQRWRNGESNGQDETAPFRTVSPSGSDPMQSPDQWSTSTIETPNAAFPADPIQRGHQPVTVTMDHDQHRGSRGFFLGLVAFLLIGAVLGLYGWSVWLSADMRDTISGWFDFIR